MMMRPDWRKALREYAAVLRERHPDCADLRVERNPAGFPKSPRWITYPTGIRQFVVPLRVSCEGYRTKTASMEFEEGTGRWSVR